VLAVASCYAGRATGATVREEPPVFLFQARAPGPNTYAGVIDFPPVFLFGARLPGPLTYKIVYDHPPGIDATVSFLVPDDSEVSLLAPRAAFYGYTFDGTSLSIPIADLAGLSAEEADAVTGDWRKILQKYVSESDDDPTMYKIPNRRYASRDIYLPGLIEFVVLAVIDSVTIPRLGEIETAKAYDVDDV
jgi:hypothetical protein